MLLQLFNSLQLLCPVLETWKFVNTIPKRKRFRNPRTNNIWFLPSQEKEFQRQKSRNIWGSVFWIPDGLKSAINKSLPELMKIKFLHQVLFSSEIVKKINSWLDDRQLHKIKNCELNLKSLHSHFKNMTLWRCGSFNFKISRHFTMNIFGAKSGHLNISKKCKAFFIFPQIVAIFDDFLSSALSTLRNH